MHNTNLLIAHTQYYSLLLSITITNKLEIKYWQQKQNQYQHAIQLKIFRFVNLIQKHNEFLYFPIEEVF